MSLLMGIDTGGTYTDAVIFESESGVVASTKALTRRHDLSFPWTVALSLVTATGRPHLAHDEPVA